MKLFTALWRFIQSRPHLLGMLLVTDLIFFGLHLTHHYSGWLSDERFSIETDRGFAETFQYVQELWCVLILSQLAMRARRFLFLSWTFLYTYFLIDDILMLHEKMSVPVSRLLNLSAFVGARHALDIGEVLWSLAMATLLLPPIFLTHRRSRGNDRNLSGILAMCTLALISCGIGVDFLHTLMHGLGKVPAGLLEDGGEMLAMSTALSALFAALAHPVPALAESPAPATVPVPAAPRAATIIRSQEPPRV